MSDSNELTHVDKSGKARMVDISHKERVKRTALASGKIFLAKPTISMISENTIKKGDVLSVANIAGVMGAKKTSDLIPLCHNIQIDQIAIEMQIRDDHIEITGKAICVDKTGIEMEALTAVSVSALTIYDMCKAVDKNMLITDIHLIEKTKEKI